MLAYLPLAIYILGYILFWRRSVWAIANEFNLNGGIPDGQDIVFGLIMGSLLNLVWPIILVGRGVRAIYRARGQHIALAIAPRREREKLELKLREKEVRRIEHEQAMREIEIRRLERETGIGQGMTWILWGIYWLGFVLCWRPTIWLVLTMGEDYDYTDHDTFDFVMSSAVGTLINCFWPVILVGRVAWKVANSIGSNAAVIIAPRRHQKQVALLLKEKELAEREAEIVRLERETGVGQGQSQR